MKTLKATIRDPFPGLPDIDDLHEELDELLEEAKTWAGSMSPEDAEEHVERVDNAKRNLGLYVNWITDVMIRSSWPSAPTGHVAPLLEVPAFLLFLKQQHIGMAVPLGPTRFVIEIEADMRTHPPTVTSINYNGHEDITS